jgi:flagellar hook-basal body complex protein FliE
MEQAAHARKYVILQEKDPGFGIQRPPEGFARLDANKEGMTLSLQVKNLREGALPYTVILVYSQNDELRVIRAGSLEIASRSGFFSRKLDAGAAKSMNLQPENILYVVIASEHPEKTNIPMVGICNKACPWNESIRQRLRKEPSRAVIEAGASSKLNSEPDVTNAGISPLTENTQKAGTDEAMGIISQSRPDKGIGVQTNVPAQAPTEANSGMASENTEMGKDAFAHPNPVSAAENPAGTKPDAGDFAETLKQLFSQFRNTESKADEQAQRPEKAEKKPAVIEERGFEKPRVDDIRLERKLKDCFEAMEPFSNPRHDYSWYRVNDLARLSNLLFACNMRIPLFANPKILVGLFKYRHLLAGFYRSDHNDMKYFVLGVPSRDDSEGRPFERISRWVEVQNPDYGDMTGYWLVYINLQSGEFVR